jgi:hypothetical protein
MADKEYTRSNRSDYFANRLRSQNDSIALQDISRKTRYERSRLFMSTALAD